MRRKQNLAVYVGLLPAFSVGGLCYLSTLSMTVFLSFTSSTILPKIDLVGLAQYYRLFDDSRWSVSVINICIVSALLIAGTLLLGTLLAIGLDRRVRAEGVLRTIYLYPLAMSFAVSGVVWGWLLSPDLGIQHAVRQLGWTSFTFDWTIHGELAIYAVILVAIWQGVGLSMAIMLAGMRGVDSEIWNASRVDGVKTWRVYLHIILPSLRGSIISSVFLLSLGTVKMYELVLVLTRGGPGISSEVPAKFIMDYLFERRNVALASAAATTLLVAVSIILIPWLYREYFRVKQPGVV
jgi:glucose/mannose transport system permease protein